MSSPNFKLAERIIKSLKEVGYIERSELNKFISLGRDQGKEVIRYLIDLEEDPQIKGKLYELHQQKNFRYDSRLEILAVWTIFSVSIKESFNSEDVV